MTFDVIWKLTILSFWPHYGRSDKEVTVDILLVYKDQHFDTVSFNSHTTLFFLNLWPLVLSFLTLFEIWPFWPLILEPSYGSHEEIVNIFDPMWPFNDFQLKLCNNCCSFWNFIKKTHFDLLTQKYTLYEMVTIGFSIYLSKDCHMQQSDFPYLFLNIYAQITFVPISESKIK